MPDAQDKYSALMISRFAADEPDISAKDIEENVEHVLGSKVSTRYRRRKVRVSLVSFNCFHPRSLTMFAISKGIERSQESGKVYL